MTTNGQPQAKRLQGQLVDAARVTQLQQQTQAQAQLLVSRALSDVSNLANALQFLTEQANAGNGTARQVLSLLVANLDAATATAAGIVLPRYAPPPGS